VKHQKCQEHQMANLKTQEAQVLPPHLQTPSDGYIIDPTTIPVIARRVVEFLREEKPDAVIAADRGGRMLALAVHAGWRLRYPGERFPALDGKIHFARLSRRDLDYDTFRRLVNWGLVRAGIAEPDDRDEYFLYDRVTAKDPESKLMVMDDWITRGSTIVRVQDIAAEAGLKPDNVSAAVMYSGYGRRLPLNRYIVAEPENDKIRGFSWSDSSYDLGITYYNGVDPTRRSEPDFLENSRQQRSLLQKSTREYYRAFFQHQIEAAAASGHDTPLEAL
jgi:adenine/guanine phosphoribosyltransferase-like PRPP-binding protein